MIREIYHCTKYKGWTITRWLTLRQWLGEKVRGLLDDIRSFCQQMWWDIPLDWDEQVQGALGQKEDEKDWRFWYGRRWGRWW